jgi:hypothetical protein
MVEDKRGRERKCVGAPCTRTTGYVVVSAAISDLFFHQARVFGVPKRISILGLDRHPRYRV